MTLTCWTWQPVELPVISTSMHGETMGHNSTVVPVSFTVVRFETLAAEKCFYAGISALFFHNNVFIFGTLAEGLTQLEKWINI